ncbi:MAG: condensation domain-containing protein, partial [Spirochaetaceae bacterium]|nr:condensation domain-containing protein [Spirochaetaceae bacterium]
METIKILTERLFLRSPNINVCFRILIDKKIESERFNAAMDNVCKRHPFLTCSIKIDNDHNAWLVPDTSRTETEYYKSEEMPDWQIWFKKTDNTPFDFLHGPLVKIAVIGGDTQTEIILLGHHIIGDGMGYLNLAKDILLALDNKLDTTAQIPPVNNKFAKCGRLKLLSKIYAKKLNNEW